MRRTLPRPYAVQLTVPEAIAELRRGAGTQFDPAVVDALSELVIELEWPPQRSHANAQPRQRRSCRRQSLTEAPPAPISS